MSHLSPDTGTPNADNSFPRENGVHLLLDVWGCGPVLLDNPDWWNDTFRHSLAGSGIDVLHSHFHRFHPHGLTGFFLLTASHLSVHTWPENDYAAIDLFTCSPEHITETVIKRLKERFSNNKLSLRKLSRGYQTTSAQ